MSDAEFEEITPADEERASASTPVGGTPASRPRRPLSRKGLPGKGLVGKGRGGVASRRAAKGRGAIGDRFKKTAKAPSKTGYVIKWMLLLLVFVRKKPRGSTTVPLPRDRGVMVTLPVFRSNWAV